MSEATILYFGSFNPIHHGHIAIAEYLLEQGYGRELWFIVSPHNPLKSPLELAPETDRLKMVELAIDQSPYKQRIKASGIEFDLPKPSYTVATLDHLRGLYPDKKFVILMGADNLASIDRWRNYEKLLAEYDILVYPRVGAAIRENLGARITILTQAPLFQYDATSVRQAVKNENSIEKMVDSEVVNYIKIRKLYE